MKMILEGKDEKGYVQVSPKSAEAICALYTPKVYNLNSSLIKC